MNKFQEPCSTYQLWVLKWVKCQEGVELNWLI